VPQNNLSSALRDLLARRLMREGRFGEAGSYFCSDAARTKAADYAAALRRYEWAWTKQGRAEALFQAATIARNSGMEFMGTEEFPDQAATGGEFEAGFGQDRMEGAFISEGEKHRFAASAVQPYLRFHYRYIAAQEAERAASLLPPRSQAFAAVLCAASNWMLDAPDGGKRGWEIYQRYVKAGAHMPWADHFGRSCPKPDFAGAGSSAQMLRAARRWASQGRWYLAGGMLALSIVLAMLLRSRFTAIFRRR